MRLDRREGQANTHVGGGLCMPTRKDEAKKKVSLLVFFCFPVKKEQTSAASESEVL